jgi:DNA-directed RNA polymerase subunit RPC12/RpoP
MTSASNQPTGARPMAASSRPSSRLYICLACGQEYERVEQHDFNLCAKQVEMTLVWQREKGEVIYAN